MFKYKKWNEIVQLKNLVNGKVVLKDTEIKCDGWYLFGKITLIMRQNI